MRVGRRTPMSADPYESPRSQLDALIAAVKTLGARVDEIWQEPEGSRFIGTFDGHQITLFPKYNRNFALSFTLSHLYGHMVQATKPTPRSDLALAIVSRGVHPLTRDEVQSIYWHEIEAAAIGRGLMNLVGPVSDELDRQYSRMFFADFHYLVNFLETGVGGPDAFETYLRREPIPWRLIEAAPMPLVNLSKFPIIKASAIVV